MPSALKIVGDRYALNARQRMAVMRGACPDAAMESRMQRMRPRAWAGGKTVRIDGYNVLTTIEVALGGGVVLASRDMTYRDIASMHGSYRRVEETLPALELIGSMLADSQIGCAAWYFDQPVSNSGRLKTMMAELAEAKGWNWDIQIVPNPDVVLAKSRDAIASADSVILDACGKWINLAWEVVMEKVPQAWVVSLR
jgi:hypothetical protein